MGRINFSVHPLFLIFGFFYALSGRIFEFVICSFTAVIHELGHSLSAHKRGYKLNKIVLMPFGAVAKGNIDGLKIIDELAVSLSGPLVNLIVAVFFVAVWWIEPSLYPYTEIVATNNFYMAVINLIPAYPLDGGRTLNALLSLKLKKDKAFAISKGIGIAFSVVLFCLFVLSIFYTPNISLLFFSMFVLFGAISKEKENKYVRLYGQTDSERLKRGAGYKIYAVDKSMTLKKLMNIIDTDCLVEVRVYNGGIETKRIYPNQVQKILCSEDIYKEIGDIVQKKEF